MITSRLQSVDPFSACVQSVIDQMNDLIPINILALNNIQLQQVESVLKPWAELIEARGPIRRFKNETE